MTEELHYASVVFKNGGSPPKESLEDSAVYSTVKQQVPATSETTEGGAVEGRGARSQTFLLLLACLGILSVLLMACVGTIIYIWGVTQEQKAIAGDVLQLEREIQQLMTEKETLQNKTEELRSDRDELNRTLGVILSFPSFPGSDFCPSKKCQPCRANWIPFQDHCYLFYEKRSPWKTWEGARFSCQDSGADLVVVDSIQEQTFITNHTKAYYDRDHGYWMGLRLNAGKDWVWIDGRNETAGYWMPRMFNDYRCVQTIPGHDANVSWSRAWCYMNNKFICEHESLIRTAGG